MALCNYYRRVKTHVVKNNGTMNEQVSEDVDVTPDKSYRDQVVHQDKEFVSYLYRNQHNEVAIGTHRIMNTSPINLAQKIEINRMNTTNGDQVSSTPHQTQTVTIQIDRASGMPYRLPQESMTLSEIQDPVIEVRLSNSSNQIPIQFSQTLPVADYIQSCSLNGSSLQGQNLKDEAIVTGGQSLIEQLDEIHVLPYVEN